MFKKRLAGSGVETNPMAAELRTALFLIFGVLCVQNLEGIRASAEFIASVFSPIMIGLSLAYIVLKTIHSVEGWLKVKKVWAAVITYSVLLALIMGLVIFIVPGAVRDVGVMLGDMPSNLTKIEEYLGDKASQVETIEKMGIRRHLDEITDEALSYIGQLANISANALISLVLGISGKVYGIVVGVIFSGYIVFNEDYLKKLLRQALESSPRLKKTVEISDGILYRYLFARVIDSFVIFLLSLAVFAIFGIPKPVLSSVIIGITNIVPYFGPFIGAVPVIVITALYNPGMLLWTALIIFILQQLDGLVIGPRIIGQSMQLNPIWILASIIVGGNICGIWGMLFAVPFFATVARLWQERADKKKELAAMGKA